MRTKFLKFGMPLVAFMVAIAFAFATEKEASKEEAFIIGYIMQDGVCQIAPIDCNNLQDVPCTYLGQQVKRFSNGTTCSVLLYHKANWQL